MRVLALISGGKDSIFAMHVVHASGHDIVVLGHISPSPGIHGQNQSVNEPGRGAGIHGWPGWTAKIVRGPLTKSE